MNASTAIATLDRANLRLVTSSEAAGLWGVTPGAGNEMLRRLSRAGIVRRVRRGLWARGEVDPLVAVERVAEPDVAYVSLLTALRIHGLVEQIAPATQAVTTGRARSLDTPLGRFELHHVAPAFFRGFDRDRGFALASAEKALVDTLYLSATRDRSLASLPELDLDGGFSAGEARRWAREVPSAGLRRVVEARLEALLRRS